MCTEKGPLVRLKENGWRKSNGEIVVWIDDDIVCNPNWLQNIVSTFDNNKLVVGVTGPTFVPYDYRQNRDILANTWFRSLYTKLFLDGRGLLPGRISSWGASTIGGNFKTFYTNYSQCVDFLEPSQFALRRNVVEKVGGFDLNYDGIAEWCDVDLCYRIKQCGLLLFIPSVHVTHYPEKGDEVYKKRLKTNSRYLNYCRFARKFLKPTFKNKLYKLFLKLYFFAKERGWV